MREIKFRAWNKDTKEMVIYFNPVLHAEQDIFHFSDTVNLFGNYELMQYTGLKDLNDTDVFEGDRVTFRRAGELIWELGEIQITPENGVIIHCHYDNLPSNDYYGVRWTEVSMAEVIGNIYEKD